MPPLERSKSSRIDKRAKTELALGDFGAFFSTNWTDTFGAVAIRVFYVSSIRRGMYQYGMTLLSELRWWWCCDVW